MSELDPILDSLFQSPFAAAPSLGQLERRRGQRRRRRTNTRLAAGACATAALFALARVTREDPHQVHTINDDGRTPTTVSSTTLSSLPSGLPSELGSAPGSAPEIPGGVDGTIPGVLPTTTATTVPPTSEGCAVESAYNEGVETPVGGAGYGTKSCSYTATVAGGYVAHGFFRVAIMRDGHYVAVYDNGYEPGGPNSSASSPPPCGAVGTIEPGDRVFLSLRYGAETIADPTFVRAGADQHC